MMHTWNDHRARRRPSASAWAGALLVLLGGACIATAQADPPEATGISGEAAEGFDAVAVLGAATDETARRQAARAILDRFGTDASLSVPSGWLTEEPASSLRLLWESADQPEHAQAFAAAIVRALGSGGQSEPPATTFGRLSADARTTCLSVLCRSNDPAAAETLVSWLESAPVGRRGPMLDALVAMSGREDLGESPEAWRQWINRHRHLPTLGWRAMLATSLRDRALRLSARERELLRSLTDASRRLYAATPAAERPAMLARMLADPEPALRLTATDLLMRELERGVLPTPEVSAAVVQLLEDPRATIRQAAAVLVDRIVPQGSAARLSVALRRETDPEVAAVMLRAFRRSPDAAAIDAVMRWLEFGEPTRAAAMRAVLGLLESGFTPTAGQRDRVLAQINPQQSAALTPAGVQVLARLGDDAAVGVVRSLLYAERADIRKAAADALAPRPGFVNDLLLAAEADPALLPRAAEAAAAHKPWAPSLRRVATLELRTPTDARAAEPLPITAGLARVMTVHDRLAAAQTLVGQPLAIRAILGEPVRDMFSDGPAGDRDYARARSLLELPERPPEPAAPLEAEPTDPDDPPPATPPG